MRRSGDGSERPFRLGILVCDHVEGDELLAASAGADYPDMYDRLLRPVMSQLTVRTHDVVNEEVPVSVDECDGWLITGSRWDAYRDEPWLIGLRAFVAQLWLSKSRTVGVCFGHQVVAHALGGAVEPTGEWKLGPQEMSVDATPWFGGGDVWLHAMHQDAVATLPPEALDVATGTTASHPMFIVGDSMLCLQDHPEFNSTYTSALIAIRRQKMGDDVARDGLTRAANIPTDGPTVAAWIAAFLLDERSAIS